VVILVHPWRQVGGPVDLELLPPGNLRRQKQKFVHLPSLAPQELGSLELALPETWKGQGVQAVFLGGKPLELARFKGTPQVVVTTRFDAMEAGATLLIRLERPAFATGDEQIRARLYRWQR
jgi:hypothetical protein